MSRPIQSTNAMSCEILLKSKCKKVAKTNALIGWSMPLLVFLFYVYVEDTSFFSEPCYMLVVSGPLVCIETDPYQEIDFPCGGLSH